MPDYPPASLSVEPEPVVVTSDSGSGAPRFARDGIVQRRGKFTLVSGPFTPRESMIEDLLAVHDAGTRPCSHVRDRLADQLQTVDARIAELQALRNTLALQLEAAASGPEGCDPRQVCSYL